MKRFHYSAIQKGQACEGIVRADSIDLAKEKLIQEGYEAITISLLSSVDFGPDLIDQPETDKKTPFSS